MKLLLSELWSYTYSFDLYFSRGKGSYGVTFKLQNYQTIPIRCDNFTPSSSREAYLSVKYNVKNLKKSY